MPYSASENKTWASEKIKQINPKSALDVGAGAGAYGKILKALDSTIKVDAIEVWTPYLDEFNLKSIYDNIYNYEAKEHKDWNYDLAIFGDVLEHMTKKDAIDLYEKAAKKVSYILFSMPIIHLPIGPEYGKPNIS